MNNIFENAYFGKPYRTRDGKKAFYHGSKKHKSGDGKVWIYHYLMVEPETINVLGEDVIINHYDAYINDNGIGRLANLKYCKDSGVNAGYDITSEWQEEISEEELDKLAETEANNTVGYWRYDSTDLHKWYGFRDGFKVGIRKVLEYINNNKK